MFRHFKKMMLRAWPELGGRHVTQIGVIAAVHDHPTGEKAADDFRPRYSVSVQMLTPGGGPDTSRPIIEGLPLPAWGAGDARGLFAYPAIGTRVRIGFDWGLPTHPHISDILPPRVVPDVAPGDFLMTPGEWAEFRLNRKGATLKTDGALTEDSHSRLIMADVAVEEYGRLTRTLDGNMDTVIGGQESRRVLGSMIQEIGGDVRRAVLGGEGNTIMGDRSELVVGKWEGVAGGDFTLTSHLGALLLEALTGSATLRAALGDVLVEAIAGSATFKSAVALTLDSLAINLGVGATHPLILSGPFAILFDAHTHSSGGAGPPNVLMSATPGLLSVGVKVK